MKRINLYIDDTMFEHFKKLSGTLSENIRIAMYEHLKRLAEFNSSASQSKVGEKNG